VPALGDSEKLDAGETVIAIGNALSEYRNSVTKGVISGINRRVVAGDGTGQSEVLEEALQTDAAINPGNSGGPLIDLNGEVIGMNSAVNRSGQSIGFAIPIDAVKVVIDSVKAQGRIVRPWLGVRYVMLTPDSAKANGLDVGYGAMIVGGTGSDTGPAIMKGSPAEKAGLKTGDVLLEIDGVKLDDAHALSSLIATRRAGDTIRITYLRDKAQHTLEATLGELPAAPAQ
jgi:serine protease Do